MNRDEGIYNLSHVYDPVIQEEVNIKNISGTGSGEKFSPTQQLDHHNNNSPDEADCFSLRSGRQKRKCLIGLVNNITLDYSCYHLLPHHLGYGRRYS